MAIRRRRPFPSETQDRFIVRLPDGMRDRITAVAKANNRSMNAEIVVALEAWLNADSRSKLAAARLLRMTARGDPLEALQAQLSDHEKRLAELEKGK